LISQQVRHVQAALVACSTGEHIELLLALSDSLGIVKADRTQLEQVTLNLSVNTCDAMAEGGKLTIESSKVEMDEANPARPAYMLPGNFSGPTVAVPQVIQPYLKAELVGP
jgi:C4-dicarboxylate-specific signal transduction histidine kinase